MNYIISNRNKGMMFLNQNEQLGKTIRNLREDRGISLRDLASQIDVSPGYMSLIETGKKPVTDKMLHEIAHALKADDGKLFNILGRTPYRITQALESRDSLKRLTLAAQNNLDNEQLDNLTYAVEHGMEAEICPTCYNPADR